MKLQVIPGGKDAEISFNVKCVNVENERVYSEISVMPQRKDSAICVEKCEYPVVYKKRKTNLVEKTFESPNFLKLNAKPAKNAIRSNALRRKSEPIPRNFASSVNGTDFCGFEKRKKVYPPPLLKYISQDMSLLVDKLLLDIYGPAGDKWRSGSESTVSSSRMDSHHPHVQRARLWLKSAGELRILIGTLKEHINYVGLLLIRQLRRRDNLLVKRDKFYDVVTAHLQALSGKQTEDIRMRFSLTPQPGESGHRQWLDAMKMVARLPGGIPAEFRKTLWITLAERHLAERGVDWKQAEKLCFNEWSNPDDDELGIQIVKDLHRTGCSLFCGAAGRDNQVVLRRVLLGFARWNKSVGYCQGLNVLAAQVLQVVDRAESAAVKVMIYLVEGVLPEGYFADNLRGLSIDMAVFRDLLRVRLPKLSRHLENLQSDAKDKTSGSSYEPPLTNVFTMQWFLTMFCHCLPQDTVIRVWDLVLLEGDDVLLRTALAIWEGLSNRIMTVHSADEFYSIMGVLTRDMLENTDTNHLIKAVVSMGPLNGVTSLRERHRYNITPWARHLSDDEDTDTEEDDRLAVAAAAAMIGVSQIFKKDRSSSPMTALLTASSDRERLAWDISSLKQQYAKLCERQRQAHIILSAACASQSISSSPSPAMNHLLVGKSALVSGKSRQIGPPHRPPSILKTKSTPAPSRTSNREDRQSVTLHWKDMKKSRDRSDTLDDATSDLTLENPRSLSRDDDSDSDSTSTELCDEPDRLSDVDSNDPSSASDKWSPRPGSSPLQETSEPQEPIEEFREGFVAEIADQIEKLSENVIFDEEKVPELPQSSENETKTEASIPDRTSNSPDRKFELHFYGERCKSATTPGSAKSFSSGETMGPDSKVSSISASPRTPQELVQEKSVCSSVSSESKTVTLRSVDFEGSKFRERRELVKMGSTEVSSSWTTTMSTDSLQNKSEVSPRLVVSSSSESCSPGKLKSSERSFSSDLQSPISANSINYTSNCKNGANNASGSSSIETIAITSPFYPIANPNQKTPSPYNLNSSVKPRFLGESTEETSPRNKPQVEYKQTFSDMEDCKSYLYKSETTNGDAKNYSERARNVVDVMGDSYTEDDTLSPLPHEGRIDFSHRNRDVQENGKLSIKRTFRKTNGYERSCSSLDKPPGVMQPTPSCEDILNSAAKKRSSDVLEDIRHLEAKSTTAEPENTSMLTKKTGYIWEDVKNLEARRQGTFSDSASNFSRDCLEGPFMGKSYVVEPKISIDENSDSILMKSFSQSKEEDDGSGEESKLGVWTKVKPRKRSDSGRRSSDRALKIIQENSAILQKILTCQAKRRLPDLEAITKEITISPINEEISKIFSPILEKMGLNEHEINEELARINFKELELSEPSVCGSEFDAKINDELSKLSIIDDNEEINHRALDEIISQDYLDTREALIDRQINEELSKLLANCDTKPIHQRGNGIEAGAYSYKSRLDSGPVQAVPAPEEDYLGFSSRSPKYEPSKYTFQHQPSPVENVDVYRDLDQPKKPSPLLLPTTSITDIMPPLPHDPSAPYTPEYAPKIDKSFESSILTSPYESYKFYDYESRLSPVLPNNSYTLPRDDYDYDFLGKKSTLDYDDDSRKPPLSRENIEFRIRYGERDENLEKESYRGKKENSYFDSYTYERSRFRDYDEESDLVPRELRFPGSEEISRLEKFSPGKRPVSHPEFPGASSFPRYEGASARETSSLSLEEVDFCSGTEMSEPMSSPRKHFSPFPARNASKKPKELALKLGLYSPPNSTTGQLKRS